MAFSTTINVYSFSVRLRSKYAEQSASPVLVAGFDLPTATANLKTLLGADLITMHGPVEVVHGVLY